MPEVVNTPIYLDWSFWAVVVAAIAIILSQIQPIHLLLKSAKLDIESYSRIHITHKVGNPNVQLHLIITNIGGRTIKVKGISLDIFRDGSLIVSLPAQNYLQDPQTKNTVLFTRFPLKPNEEWSHFVNFLNFFPRAEEKVYREAESNLKQNISNKMPTTEKDKLVEADPKFVKPFLEFFDKKFIWSAGEYEMTLKIETDNSRTNLRRKFRFTLFESDSKELTEYSGDFKFGAGIYWDNTKHTGLIVQINEV